MLPCLTGEDSENKGKRREMESIQHRSVAVNGLNMHVAELGQGPTILFLHGFPELWYSWRHQMVFMADRGYRAVAPDMRGYGDTTGVPLDDHSKFSTHHVVGDLVSLLDTIAKDEEQVFVVGHDWGAIIAWHLSLYRPDKVKAMVNLSIPLVPRHPQLDLAEVMRSFFGQDHYMTRFQEPGDIEAEFAEVGVEKVLQGIYAYRDTAPFYFPKDKRFDYSAADRPSWLSEQDLKYFVSKYEQTGFTGVINYYRALKLSWELNAPWSGAQVKVPAKFIVGEFDLVYHIPGMKEFLYEGGFQKDVPMLQEVVVIEGAAHFVNQERPDEINEHIYSYLKQF